MQLEQFVKLIAQVFETVEKIVVFEKLMNIRLSRLNFKPTKIFFSLEYCHHYIVKFDPCADGAR